jgi:hypothetical protein
LRKLLCFSIASLNQVNVIFWGRYAFLGFLRVFIKKEERLKMFDKLWDESPRVQQMKKQFREEARKEAQQEAKQQAEQEIEKARADMKKARAEQSSVVYPLQTLVLIVTHLNNIVPFTRRGRYPHPRR